MKTKNSIEDKIRVLSHLLIKSGNLAIGFDHLLVVFPSILLMAKVLNSNNFNNNSISLLLFCTGVGNILFYIITKSKIPVFMAPSFTFIGFTNATMQLSGENIIIAKINVTLGYFFASIIFLLMGILYKSSLIKKYIRLTLPDALVGPLISLIGLDLLGTAISDSGFNAKENRLIFIAILTLITIVYATTFKHKLLRNASILFGVLVGVIVSAFMGQYDFVNSSSSIMEFPRLDFVFLYKEFPNYVSQIKWLDILVAVFPATVIIFSENVTKITLVEKMIRAENCNENQIFINFYEMAIIGHSISLMISILLGSVPNAIYAENIALMEVNNVEGIKKNRIYEEHNSISSFYHRLSTYPLIIASCITIFLSFFTVFQDLLRSIPMAVYGGMELFIFALISAQGVQLLVDRKVNYKKVTNQIITSMTLLTGLSGVSIKLGVTEIKGLSLAFLVGVVLNLFFKICSYLGRLNEKIDIAEIVELINNTFENETIMISKNEELTFVELQQFLSAENKADSLQNLLETVKNIKIKINDSIVLHILEGNDGVIVIKANPYKDEYIKIINDFSENILVDFENKIISVIVNENMSKRSLKKIFVALSK